MAPGLSTTGFTLSRPSRKVKSLVESKRYDLSPQIHPHTRCCGLGINLRMPPLIGRGAAGAGMISAPHQRSFSNLCINASLLHRIHHSILGKNPENMVNQAILSVEGSF